MSATLLRRASHHPEKSLLSNSPVFSCCSCHSCFSYHSCKKDRKNKKDRKDRNFQFSILNFPFSIFHSLSECISRSRCKACVARESAVYSMVNEHFERKHNAADAREMCSPRVGFASGFLCQTSEQLRSLLDANEEVAMRSLVQKAPARHTRPQGTLAKRTRRPLQI